MANRVASAFLLSTLLVSGAALATDSAGFPTRLVSPAGGATLFAGETVRVAWQVDVAPKLLDPAVCEQEIMLSLDGGRLNTVRVTPMLAPDVRAVSWRVPDVVSDDAVLDIRLNCGAYEIPAWIPWKPLLKSSFRIVKNPGKAAGVSLAPPPTAASAGEEIPLRWESDVKGVTEYEVRVSFDDGNHFVTVGRTTETSFRWNAPEAFGRATFQVVARDEGGTVWESAVPAEPQTRIGPVRSR